MSCASPVSAGRRGDPAPAGARAGDAELSPRHSARAPVPRTPERAKGGRAPAKETEGSAALGLAAFREADGWGGWKQRLAGKGAGGRRGLLSLRFGGPEGAGVGRKARFADTSPLRGERAPGRMRRLGPGEEVSVGLGGPRCAPRPGTDRRSSEMGGLVLRLPGSLERPVVEEWGCWE